MMVPRLSALLVMAWVSLPGGHGQAPGALEWTVNRFTNQNGLPQNSVRQLLLTSDDHLYIATEGGITHYDGRVFRNLPASDDRSGSGFRMRNLFHARGDGLLCDDVRGNLYKVATVGTHQLELQAEGLGYVSFGGMAPSKRLYEWVVRRYVQQRWTALADASPLYMDEREHGKWLLGYGKALQLMRDTVTLQKIELKEDLESMFRVNGLTYVKLKGQGLGVLPPSAQEVRKVTCRHVRGGPAIVHLDGRFFWDPIRGLVHYLDDHDVYRVEAGAAPNELLFTSLGLDLPEGTVVSSLVEVPEDHVVILGTVTKGMFMYRRRMMRSVVCDPQPGKSNSLYAQALLPDGRVLSTAVGRFAQIVGDGACEDPPAPLQNIAMTSVVRDNAGWYWAKSENAVFRYSFETGSKEDIMDARGPGACFLADGDSMWFATTRDLWLYHNGTVRHRAHFSTTQGGFPIFSLLRDDHGIMWVATCHGLYKSLDNSCERFVSVPELHGECVRSLQLLSGILFVGTYGDGAYMIRDDRIRPIPRDAMDALSHVHAFYRDSHNELWMTTDLGLIRVAFEDLVNLMEAPGTKPYFAYYGEWAGMTGSEFNGGAQPPYLELPDGRVSFPTMEGVVRFHPEHIPPAYPRYPVQLHDLRVNGEPWSMQGKVTLPADASSVSVEISMPYWGDVRNAALEYRVPGMVPHWTPLPPAAKRLELPRPSPGDLRIEVRVMGAYHGAQAPPAAVALKVLSPWYLTRSAITVFIAGLFLLIMAFLEVYTRHLRKQNIELESKVAERTRELKVLNAELTRSLRMKERIISIISHDIVSPLRFIARVANGARQMEQAGASQEELRDTLSDLSVSAENLHGHGRNLVEWARRQQVHIQPERSIVAVASVVEEVLGVVREMATIKGIEVIPVVDVEDTLLCDANALTIILNNLVTNAVAHNPAGTQVIVSCHSTPGWYRMVVLDSGHGIPPGVLEEMRALYEEGRPMEEEAHTGGMRLGCNIVREMAVLIGGLLRVESNERGTKVTILIPETTSANVVRSSGATFAAGLP